MQCLLKFPLVFTVVRSNVRYSLVLFQNCFALVVSTLRALCAAPLLKCTDEKQLLSRASIWIFNSEKCSLLLFEFKNWLTAC